MSLNKEKVMVLGEVFVKGFAITLNNEATIGTSTIVGLAQGLKYKGSIKAGAQGFAGAMIAQGLYCGVVNTINAYNELKDHDEVFMDGDTLYTVDVKKQD